MGMKQRGVLTKLDWWIVSWVGLVQHLITIFTLGYLVPDWETDVLGHYLLKRFDEWIKKHPQESK